MKLLGVLYSGPFNLLEKLRCDAQTLRNALDAMDIGQTRNALFNFAVTAYHLKEWVAEEGSGKEGAVERMFRTSVVLPICRDLANSAKHCVINLERPEYKRHPPVIDEVALSASPASTVSLGDNPRERRINVRPEGGWKLKIGLKSGVRLEGKEFVAAVTSEWEQFFEENGAKPESA